MRRNHRFKLLLKFRTIKVSQAKKLWSTFGWWTIPIAARVFWAKCSDNREAKLPIGKDNSLWIRLRTTDTDVFKQHFLDRELLDAPLPDRAQVILDVGAHVGVSARAFRLRYPDAEIICIEPAKTNFKQLEKNCGGSPNIRLINAAIMGHNGFTAIDNGQNGNWSYRTGGQATIDDNSQTETVTAMTFEKLLNTCNVEKISIAKFDVEGSETVIFDKSIETILTKCEYVVVEIHDSIDGCRESVEKSLERAQASTKFGILKSGEFTILKPTGINSG